MYGGYDRILEVDVIGGTRDVNEHAWYDVLDT